MSGHVYAGTAIGGPLDGQHLVHSQPSYMVLRPDFRDRERTGGIGEVAVTYEHVPDVTKVHGDVWRVRP